MGVSSRRAADRQAEIGQTAALMEMPGVAELIIINIL